MILLVSIFYCRNPCFFSNGGYYSGGSPDGTLNTPKGISGGEKSTPSLQGIFLDMGISDSTLTPSTGDIINQLPMETIVSDSVISVEGDGNNTSNIRKDSIADSTASTQSTQLSPIRNPDGLAFSQYDCSASIVISPGCSLLGDMSLMDHIPGLEVDNHMIISPYEGQWVRGK